MVGVGEVGGAAALSHEVLNSQDYKHQQSTEAWADNAKWNLSMEIIFLPTLSKDDDVYWILLIKHFCSVWNLMFQIQLLIEMWENEISSDSHQSVLKEERMI